MKLVTQCIIVLLEIWQQMYAKTLKVIVLGYNIMTLTSILLVEIDKIWTSLVLCIQGQFKS